MQLAECEQLNKNESELSFKLKQAELVVQQVCLSLPCCFVKVFAPLCVEFVCIIRKNVNEIILILIKYTFLGLL